MTEQPSREIFEKSVPCWSLASSSPSAWGLVEIVPLFFQKSTNEPVEGLKPYTALQMEGRDIYIREGCTVCHSQMIRPFRAETERATTRLPASVWDHPSCGAPSVPAGSARVGGRYSDDWHRAHLINPRDVVPESNMPAFPGSRPMC
jgi:cytochrome c oxidase cbb3-type subunit 2